MLISVIYAYLACTVDALTEEEDDDDDDDDDDEEEEEEEGFVKRLPCGSKR